MDTPEEFYDHLAGNYDTMTRASQRAESLRRVISGILERFPIQSGMDAACGTGLHAILMAAEGVQMTGSDISGAMLEKARSHAAAAGERIHFVQSDFTELKNRINKRFDAVFCLGNSLPHVLTADQMLDSLRNFRELLSPGGVCILELLNYERILRARERVVGAHRSEGMEFVRFYDFIDPDICFNILRLSWQGDRAATELTSTTLHPYTRPELTDLLKTAGFCTNETYGNLLFQEYDAETSGNLVIVASAGS